ncbi:tRNA (guanosine(37)-N1)-methyltransferase TrmD [Stagnimonas aquatica]|uniref:tRNA (guanine-N(1)-)-methyltransferase n=1 Tax=Stagnimonas aquatica TaxID=2689987 RepID=A0A3N0VED9_9GAMM|nr:tRNA (guanosine(37)-N1)-methyltransferase TrmD [Stagnimonas aquatica]ROH91052.1 tRNA (guanosine(37)-N1)-methyltransferase TrmD [Stagnimonas aquatica]
MRVEVLTLFPELVQQLTTVGIPRIASESGALTLVTRQLRDFSGNRWNRVDERPFGGGPGMVMQPEPLAQAVAAARQECGAKAPVLVMSPQGERFDQQWAERLAKEPAWIVVCGRYEGIDERFLASEVTAELSMGDFVLSGGEIAVMAMVDAVTRLLPGVLGDAESAVTDSFSAGHLDHPHYTRPVNWRGKPVPDVLLSGDHKAIAQWRLANALGQTWLKRPDLLAGLELKASHHMLLREYLSEYASQWLDK